MANPREKEPVIPPTEQWLTRTVPDSMGWVHESHPSYAVIGVNRVSGETSLFQTPAQAEYSAEDERARERSLAMEEVNAKAMQ